MKRVAMSAVLMFMVVAGQPIAAQASPREANHCLTPFGNARGGELIDLNELTGKSEAFVHPRHCPTVEAGEFWILGRGCVGWAVSPRHGNYPPGYSTSAATPLEDFLSKATIKLVVDAGTRAERSFTYRYASDPDAVIVWRWSDFGTGPSQFGDEENQIIALMPANHALPVGSHTADLVVVMSADHWDGLGIDPLANLLPAGETIISAGNTFEVVPRS